MFQLASTQMWFVSYAECKLIHFDFIPSAVIYDSAMNISAE